MDIQENLSRGCSSNTYDSPWEASQATNAVCGGEIYPQSERGTQQTDVAISKRSFYTTEGYSPPLLQASQAVSFRQRQLREPLPLIVFQMIRPTTVLSQHCRAFSNAEEHGQ